MATMWARHQEERAYKQARMDGRHLVSEAKRILKKRNARIPDSAHAEVERAVAGFELALRSDDKEALQPALESLDAAMDRHLAFARKSVLREYAESIAVAVAIALFLRAFVVEAFQIPSGSMIPTLEIGDHIFVAKFSYGIGIPFTNKKIFKLHEPQHGDVIVFKFPGDPSIDYIKRVIGTPGDTIEVRKNQIFLNGQPVPREHRDDCAFTDGFAPRCDLWMETLDKTTHKSIFTGWQPTDWPLPDEEGVVHPFKVPPNTVFVMGDNRDNSNDSRVWGTVPMDNIKGRALIIWWSRHPSGTGFPGWFKTIRLNRFFSAVQ